MSLSVTVVLVATVLSVAAPVASHAVNPTPDLAKELQGISQATGVAVAPNGDVYVSNLALGTVSVFEPGATTPNPAKQVGGPGVLSYPEGLAFDSAGNLFVANLDPNPGGGSIQVFNPDVDRDNPLRTITGVDHVAGIGFNSTGDLYATQLLDTDFSLGTNVWVIDPGAATPNLSKTLTVTQGEPGVAGVAIDSSDHVFVGNLGNPISPPADGTTVQVFDPGSTTPNPNKELTGLEAPGGIALDAVGNVYVANLGANQDGTTVSVFGRGSTTANPSKTLTGLTTPAFIAYSQVTGYLYVANNGASPGTVSVFGTPGPLAFAPDIARFEAVPSGSHADLTITVTNTGTAAVTPTAITPTGRGISFTSGDPGTCSTSAAITAANGTCTVKLTWSPTKAAPVSGALTIAYPFGTRPSNRVALTGGRKTQAPLGRCVTPGATAKSIPRRGTKTLMKAGCRTNAGQKVGIRASRVTPRAATRGDLRYYKLYCKNSNGKTTKTTKTSYGDRSRYCKKGALKIKSFGYKLKLTLAWSAPATGGYTAYTKTRTYKT
ncbi:MAG: SBBP repeat-containing protein [Candidatus Nanopelagicales bacterium]